MVNYSVSEHGTSPLFAFSRWSTLIIKLLSVALLYTLLGLGTLAFGSNNGLTSIIWLPTGLAWSILLLAGYRYLYAIFLGSFLVGMVTINSLPLAILVALGSTIEAVAGVWLVKRNGNFGWIENVKPHDSNNHVLLPELPVNTLSGLSFRDYAYVLFSSAITSAISAGLGTLALIKADFLVGGHFIPTFAYWWMGNILGTVLLVPAITSWRQQSTQWPKGKQLLAMGLFIGGSFLAGQIIFMDGLHELFGPIAKGYWLFLLVAWAAVHLETHGVGLILLILALMGIKGIQQGSGYFVRDFIGTTEALFLNMSLVGYWSFMLVLSMIGIILATYFTARRQTEQILVLKEKFQRAVFDATPDGMLISDKRGIITQVNQHIETLLGYTADELIGHSIEMLVTESFRMTHPKVHASYIATPTPRSMQSGQSIKARKKDGSCFDACISLSPIKTDHGLFIISALRDVTQQKQIEEHLRIASIAFESNEPMVITDADNRILQVNKAFTESTGYAKEEAIGQSISMLCSGRHDESFYRQMWECIKREGTWQGEVWDRRKNGEIYPKWLIISVVKGKDDKATHYVGTHIDITERKAAEEQIKQLAFFDPLTQLPNRRLLQDRLKHGIDRERRDGKQLALLMLDLDRFKAVNDSLGHLAGDELLQQVASRITGRLREVDMVARLGGDEFVVLLEDITNPEDAARVSEKIIHDLNLPFSIAQNEVVQIGVSIGISLHPQHGNTPEDLMDCADAALYQAKDAGRGCFAYFSEDFTLAARERINIETRLRRAIEQNELCVFYQPQVDIKEGRIVGAEALVRWQDPSYGLIPPNRFIPIAEETGLIIAIGEWVLRETCRQGQQWLNAGLPPITLAVNVSPNQFRRSDINELVATVLKETGFPAKQLELEITESGLMENQGNALDILNRLQTQGIRLAIDDFGTGYSSLAYLKHFPLDLLKIDKSFIDDIPHKQDDMEIAATIIAMGHILGFKVLAEGVETIEQLAFLQEKGCDMYQGYLRSTPVPADQFVDLLRQQ